MIIKSLENLTLNGNVYDLYAEVVDTSSVVGIYSFTCTERHNMRIDLVCYDIYRNTDSIDIICIINGILNPLTIQQDDIILFVNPDDLTTVRSNATVVNNILDSIKNANKGKQQKADVNRTKDTASRSKSETAKTFIPPNIVQTSNANVEFAPGVIILKPNF